MAEEVIPFIMGPIKPPREEDPTPGEKDAFEIDFRRITSILTNLDAELGVKFSGMKPAYLRGLRVAKASFPGLTFGGLEPKSGQFGFGLICPEDIGLTTFDVAATGAWQDILAVDGEPTPPKRRMYVYQGLLTIGVPYRYLKLTVNELPYSPFDVELLQIVKKLHKPYNFIEFLGPILIHLSGKSSVRGKSSIAGTVTTIPIGLKYAEYDYLKVER